MKPLLSTRFRLPDRTLWFGRARLFKGCVELMGWTLRGRYRRTIPLERVECAEWWTDSGHVSRKVNFALHLQGGETVALYLEKAAGHWKYEIGALLGHHMKRTSLPESAPQRSAAA